MFVGSEVVLDAGFDVVCRRLAAVAGDGWLREASEEAYVTLSRGLRRVGPVRGVSRLVEVTVRSLAVRGDVAVLALRWVATGPGRGLLPVLDADVTLTPRGGASVLAMTGSYRPPLGAAGEALDRAVLHSVAEATIRNFVTALANSVMSVELEPVSTKPPTRPQS